MGGIICWISMPRLTEFAKNMVGAILFLTRCMSMMLRKKFNWCILRIFCSLNLFYVCANLSLFIIMLFVCFCWLLFFFRVLSCGHFPSLYSHSWCMYVKTKSKATSISIIKATQFTNSSTFVLATFFPSHVLISLLPRSIFKLPVIF